MITDEQIIEQLQRIERGEVKDAYAAWGGYRSGRDSKCLIVSKDGGIVERYIVALK
jgi:hypothetical protein